MTGDADLIWPPLLRLFAAHSKQQTVIVTEAGAFDLGSSRRCSTAPFSVHRPASTYVRAG
jgi:hypothetical protein